jgi:membrane protease YdiL (CAAX protease family)
MFVPGAVALVLQIFFFEDSSLYFRKVHAGPRWILSAFLLLTVLYAAVTVLALLFPETRRLFQGLGTLSITLWTLLVLFMGNQDGQAWGRVGLQLGDVQMGQRFVLGVVLFLVLQALLNLALGLATFRGVLPSLYGLAIPQGFYPVALVLLFFGVAVIGAPLSGLAAVFGEEYGWRGFLQGEWIKLGTIRGVFLVGLVWGLWHFPVILRGIHTYPPTALGLLLGTLFFVLWGFVQSYAVLKTGSIWIAAFMHGVVNSVYTFLLAYIAHPHDIMLSFGLGVYGLICLALVVAVILRDPVWRS